MPSSNWPPGVDLECRLGCGITANAATTLPQQIKCNNKCVLRCDLKWRLQAQRRKWRLLDSNWTFLLLIIFVLGLAGISIFGDALRNAFHLVAISLLWAGLSVGLFWISDYFSLPTQLLAAIKSLWAWLCALDWTGVSIPKWSVRGTNPQRLGSARLAALLEGWTSKRPSAGWRFQSPPRFIFPKTRCLGVADTTIAATIAYIQFKDWDVKLIDRALANVPRTNEALDDLLRCATIGSLQIWGRTSFDFEWQPIEEDYWNKHEIDRPSVLSREKPFTMLIGGGRPDTGARAYINLRTSRAQLEAVWPSA